jgi:hypothetical protein
MVTNVLKLGDLSTGPGWDMRPSSSAAREDLS